MIHEFKHQTLVLFKCLLLQPKVCFDLSHEEAAAYEATTDVVFWFTLRETLHDAILSDIAYPGTDTQLGGLR